MKFNKKHEITISMDMFAKDMFWSVMNGIIWELELEEIEDTKAVTESIHRRRTENAMTKR